MPTTSTSRLGARKANATPQEQALLRQVLRLTLGAEIRPAGTTITRAALEHTCQSLGITGPRPIRAVLAGLTRLDLVRPADGLAVIHLRAGRYLLTSGGAAFLKAET